MNQPLWDFCIDRFCDSTSERDLTFCSHTSRVPPKIFSKRGVILGRRKAGFNLQVSHAFHHDLTIKPTTFWPRSFRKTHQKTPVKTFKTGSYGRLNFFPKNLPKSDDFSGLIRLSRAYSRRGHSIPEGEAVEADTDVETVDRRLPARPRQAGPTRPETQL